MEKMEAPESGVKIRMYRVGFGDCFLLAFRVKNSRETSYMLIDCGVHSGHCREPVTMQQVAESIRDSTRQPLEVLVLTHDHQDHTWGFGQGTYGKIMNRLDFREIWLPWIVNPTDSDGLKLQKKIEARRQLMERAAKRLAGMGETRFSAQLQEFLGAAKESSAVMKNMGEKNNAKFLNPCEHRELRGLNIFVLGPPKLKEYLEDMAPSSKSDIYRLAGAPALGSVGLPWEISALRLKPAKSKTAGSRLFDPGLTISEAAARKNEFFVKNYGFSRRSQHGPEGRRIDLDWLMGMQALVEYDKGLVNNTSLALAMELPQSGKVLLFPGDAQIGNIRSWQETKWDLAGRKLDANDLLAKTVFYKVGHHGSENATLKDLELEKMTDPGLVAMMPVDEEYAHNSRHWEIPAPPLLKRLAAKTKNRVIRLDNGIPSTFRGRCAGGSNPCENELYLEYTIEDN